MNLETEQKESALERSLRYAKYFDDISDYGIENKFQKLPDVLKSIYEYYETEELNDENLEIFFFRFYDRLKVSDQDKHLKHDINNKVFPLSCWHLDYRHKLINREEYLTTWRYAIAHLSSLVDSRPRDINLSKYIQETAFIYKPIAKQKNISLMVDLADEDVVLNNYKSDYLRVIDNLTRNAFDHSEDDSTVMISLLDNQMWNNKLCSLLMVGDTGGGIDPKNESRIFDKGFTTREKPDCLNGGFGLHSAREMMRNVGGDVELENRVGVGTMFSVYFPKDIACGKIEKNSEVEI